MCPPGPLDRGGNADLPPVSLWPVWRFDSGYAELARYVTPQALTLDFDFQASVSAAEEESSSPAGLDRIKAAHLYQQLAAREIAYDSEPWASKEEVQQVRHPWWLLSGRLGNCLDIALAYTGLCLAARVGALLAITDEHAFVVLTPGRLHLAEARSKPYELSGFGECRIDDGEIVDPGVRLGTGAALEAAFAADGLVAVDAVGVNKEGFGFETAVEQRPWWGEEDKRPDDPIWLVDVAHLQTEDRYAELPHPVSFRPSIRLHISGGGEFKSFAAHERVISKLRGATGVHALIGDSGRGKSTIARHLVEAAPDGAAWFLDASDRRALINSLAMARLGEEGRPGRDIPEAERNELAKTGLAQLRKAESPWLVVLDNADEDPRTLRDLIVEPKDGQQLLLTSTNEEWAEVPGCTPHRLSPVPATELGRFDERMGRLIDGRPLVSEALRCLPDLPQHLAAPPDEVDGELRGPFAYWSLLRQGAGFGPLELRVSALSAYLPPNGHPVAALESAIPSAREAVDLLAERGLLRRDRMAGSVQMHRLFGAAIRRQLEEEQPELCDETVRLATSDELVRAALDEQGDLATVARLDERLAAIDAAAPRADHDLGIALHGVAELLELHGHTRQSGAAYDRAERHLKGDPARLADCLHSRARTVNQHRTKNRAVLEQAIGWAEEARAMLLAADDGESRAEDATADRCLAMKGLLMRPLANFPVAGKTKMDLLEEALAVLEEADRRRQKSAAISDAEKARSRFNLAGIRISMAKAEPERAVHHLQQAHDIYAEVGERRRRLYGRSMEHPHIAACEFGLALVGYYRAVLIPASRPQRSEWLRDATDHAVEALRQRGLLDGAVDFEEAGKSAALLAKIALARQASPVSTAEPAEELLEEAKGELVGSGMMVEPLPPLPPGRDGLSAAIERWARSSSLRELVAEWGERPPADSGLAELLEWLESFSVAWDFRRGERNVVKPPQLTQVNEKVIAVTAKTLGLIGGGSRSAVFYDHVLILGGRARACFSRPLYTARLIEREELAAGAITALGGFRELDAGEIALAEEFAGVKVADEFDAMEAGVRRAFGLGEPRPRRDEGAAVPGEGLRVHDYESAAGVPIAVVAAPSSEPGVRRVDTPGTFAWFAVELAKLQPGQRLLVVTTDIYVPYQHADALRVLSLPFEVEVDIAGVVPGDIDPALAHTFKPHNYLQEARSAIRSLRKLYGALEGAS